MNTTVPFSLRKRLHNLFMHYIQVRFPQIAQQQGIPIVFDSDFERIILDLVFDGRWEAEIKRSVEMSHRQLKAAIEHCKYLESTPGLLSVCNNWSLLMRTRR